MAGTVRGWVGVGRRGVRYCPVLCGWDVGGNLLEAGSAGNSSSSDNSGMVERELPNLLLCVERGFRLLIMLRCCVCLFNACSVAVIVSGLKRCPYLLLAQPIAIWSAVVLCVV